MVDNGVTGHLVPVKDPQALADTLSTLITDKSLRQAMGASGRQRYLELFTLEQHLARMERFFQEVARLEHRAHAPAPRPRPFRLTMCSRRSALLKRRDYLLCPAC